MQLINITILTPHSNTPQVFTDIAESVHSQISKSGFSATLSTNKFYTDALNIIIGAGTHGTPPIKELRKILRPDNTIIFNWEQIGSNSTLITKDYLDLLSEFITWDYCSENIRALNKKTNKNNCAHEFPIIPQSSLRTKRDKAFKLCFDTGFYGAIDVPRRKEILSNLFFNRVKIKLITGAYGSNLSQELLDCRTVINIHAYETEILEIARLLRPMAMDIPIISEKSIFPDKVNWGDSGIIFSDQESLSEDFLKIVTQPEKLQTAIRKMQYFINNPDWQDLTVDTVKRSFQDLSQK